MNAPSARRVLIVGAGIGGLTAATALARTGVSVEVIEINPDPAVAGWGLSLTGPSLRALDDLGLVEPCVAAGFGVYEIRQFDSEGAEVESISLPALLGPGRPSQVGIARPALYRILSDAALDAGVQVVRGLTVNELRDTGAEVEVTLSDGTERTVDLLVGADGVHSRVRALLGIETVPRFTGHVVWRALVARPDWATSLHTFDGVGHVAGLVPISADTAYMFFTQGRADRAPLPEHTLADAMRELLEPFTGRAAEARDLITDPSKVVRRPVEVLLIDDAWHRGRALVIGDAAHSPTPHLISGAALAIEDGTILADELQKESDVERALRAFQSRRLPRCRLIVESSVRIAEQALDGQPNDPSHQITRTAHQAMAAPA